MKLKHPIKAILFDAVYTLIYPEPSVDEVYATIGAKYGSQLSPVVILNRIRKAFRRQEELDARNEYCTSEARELERWQTIVAEIFRDQPEPLAPFQDLWEHFAKPGAWRCFSDGEECLYKLSRTNYTLGIASNFDRRLHDVAEGVTGLRFASFRVSSAEIGWMKPAPQFFQAVCDRLEMKAQEILFVGDDEGNDFDGSQAAGLQAILLNRGLAKGEGNLIADLKELLALLSG